MEEAEYQYQLQPDEYYVDFHEGYCKGCGKYTIVGNTKVRVKGVISELWFCYSCRDEFDRIYRTNHENS